MYVVVVYYTNRPVERISCKTLNEAEHLVDQIRREHPNTVGYIQSVSW